MIDSNNSSTSSNSLPSNIEELNHHIKCKEWTIKILRNRQIFLKTIESSLIPFCKHIKSFSKLKKINENESYTDNFIKLKETPNFIKNVTIREYQLHGISTLYNWYLRGVGGILGDEMGLGKTLQTITFLGSLKANLGLEGPHLIITPVSVLQNWINEITKFAPSLTYRKIAGSKAEREYIFNDIQTLLGNYNIYLTTYEMISVEEAFFVDSFPWATIIIDEGHKIKNENSLLRKTLNRINCPYRLLLTGTPLQNNMHELWALLNYILPDIFKDSLIFDQAAQIMENQVNINVCTLAKNLLENIMMIRRVKNDVEISLLPKIICKIYVNMTPLQIKLYKILLDKTNIQHLKSMLNMAQLIATLSQLLKIVNHPKQILNYRLKARSDENKRILSNYYAGSQFIQSKTYLQIPQPGTEAWKLEEELSQLKGELLIKSSGKLLMLDRLLLKLKSQNSRVLIFSQYIETLDILQEYFIYRFGLLGESFLRLDGSDNRIVRELNVRAFNEPNSKLFAFLLSTKACGMGINLATADSVILYDSCWNPQIDLQAMDRAHRIGQQKQVYVYRFLTRDSFEEKINEISERKLILDHLVIAKREQKSINNNIFDIDEEDIYGFSNKNNENKVTFTFNELSKALFHGSNNINNIQTNNNFQRNNLVDENEIIANLDAELEFTINQSKEGFILPSNFEDEEYLEHNNQNSEMIHINNQDDLIKDIDHIDLFMNLESNEINSNVIDSNVLIDSADHTNNSKTKIFDDLRNKNNIIDINSIEDDENLNNHLPNRKRNAPKKYIPIENPLKKPNRIRTHEDYCFCCDDGGELIECIQCPKVYHIECLGYQEIPKGYWICPWHSCITCDRKGSNSGGILFRCLTCPVSYCFDCWPYHEMELKQLNPTETFFKQFSKFGFDIPNGSSWISCLVCSQTMKEKRNEFLESSKTKKDKLLSIQNDKKREIDERNIKLSEQYQINKMKKELEMQEKLKLIRLKHDKIKELGNQNNERNLMEKEEKLMKKLIRDKKELERKELKLKRRNELLVRQLLIFEENQKRKEMNKMFYEDLEMKKFIRIEKVKIKNEQFLMIYEELLIRRFLQNEKKMIRIELDLMQREEINTKINLKLLKNLEMRNLYLKELQNEVQERSLMNKEEMYLKLLDKKPENEHEQYYNDYNNQNINETSSILNAKKDHLNNNCISKNKKLNKNKTIAKDTHEDFCFCCDDGGKLIECSACPKVYHLLCLGYKKNPRDQEWKCPCHECIYCDKIHDNKNIDHMLYRCKYCPYSYCKECIHLVSENIQFNPILEKKFLHRNFSKYDFQIPTNIKWIICVTCIEENKR